MSFNDTGLVGDALVAHKRILASRDILAASDAAVEAAEEHSGNLYLAHKAVLTVARAGALSRAYALYHKYGLDQIDDNDEIVALSARLAKDRALRAPSDATWAAQLEVARKRYRRAYLIKETPYPLINSATLGLLINDRSGARQDARKVLRHLNSAPAPAEGMEAYWATVTRIEALMVLGDYDAAKPLLADARHLAFDNFNDRASTIRQLERILVHNGRDTDWLEPLRPGAVLHYCGHMFNLGADNDQDPGPLAHKVLQAQIKEFFDKTRIDLAVGSLAAGSDILIAEAALEAGASLRLFIPADIERFRARSITPFGDWGERFDTCLSRAESVEITDPEDPDIQNASFFYASRMSMGETRRTALERATRSLQLAVWDSQENTGFAGTGADVRLWREKGGESHVIPFPWRRSNRSLTPSPAPGPNTAFTSPASTYSDRDLRAMLFADIAGFSHIPDRHMPRMLDQVFTPLAECLKNLKIAPEAVNSWGDGLFLVFDDIEASAVAALALKHQFRAIDLAQAGLPADLALRIACHYAPVLVKEHPIRGTLDYFGKGVTLAARIEPATKPGSIFVSRAYANGLNYAAPGHYDCMYLGPVVPTKATESIPIFSLRPFHHRRFVKKFAF